MKPVCDHPWKSLWVDSTGKTTFCPQNKTEIGNLYNNTIEEVINSKEAIKVRKLFSENKYCEAGCDKDCPFLRGSFDPPENVPPHEELCAPKLTDAIDDTKYSKNKQKVDEEFKNLETRVESYPLFIDVQPILRCNFDCFMCGQPHDSPLIHEQKIYD